MVRVGKSHSNLGGETVACNVTASLQRPNTVLILPGYPSMNPHPSQSPQESIPRARKRPGSLRRVKSSMASQKKGTLESRLDKTLYLGEETCRTLHFCERDAGAVTWINMVSLSFADVQKKATESAKRQRRHKVDHDLFEGKHIRIKH